MKNYLESWIKPFYTSKMVLFNLLFAAYIWLIQPTFFRILEDSYLKQINFSLGVFLLFVPFLECIGLVLTQSVQQVYRKSTVPNIKPSNSLLVLFIFALITHLGFACIYLLFSFQFMAIVPFAETSLSFQFLVLLALFIGLAKEGFVIVILLAGLSMPGIQVYGTSRFDQWMSTLFMAKGGDQTHRSMFIRRIIGEVFLFVYSVITFTVMWDFMIQLNPPEFYGSEPVFEFIGLLFYFLLVYLPLSAPSLVSELNHPGSRMRTAWKIISIFLLALLCILFRTPLR